MWILQLYENCVISFPDCGNLLVINRITKTESFEIVMQLNESSRQGFH